MNFENFCYWLNGYLELLAAGGEHRAGLPKEQIACVRDHLALVFEKTTPDRSIDQKKMNKVDREKMDKMMKSLDEMSVRQDLHTTTTCAWIGGGHGQQYC